MVVGAVGSGKSSVVSAILGELAITSGSLNVNGSMAYVAQEAFIFNATVRDNIIFGKPYDAEKYRRVIEASALMADLGQFTAGDKTEIGERGVNMSGGQKQRISIARALYSDADIVLLDDPLSAVDSHVGKHLFHKAIKGYLADKLVILTANQLQYLPYADHIIFLNEGSVVATGNFKELMQTNVVFKDQMAKFGVTSKGEQEEKSEEKPKEIFVVEEPKENITKSDDPKEETEAKSGTLVVEEEKQEGLIGFNVYWYYFKKGGLGMFFLMVFFLAFAVGARVVTGWWLSVWLSNGATTGYVLELPIYVGIYGALIGADVIGFTIASLVDVSLSTRASKQLHYGMLSRIIRAPTAFFDITPMGRIVNRFAKELDLIDKVLPYQLFQYINSIFTLLAVLASMAFASPYFLIAIAAVIVGYYFFQWNFRKTFVETQRMEALSRAPIISQIGETMRGAATIRAYRMEEVFKNVNYYLVDENSKQRIAQRFLLSWFGLVLDGMGTVLVLILMVMIVSLRVSGVGGLQGGYAAFALANTAGLTPILSFLAINSVETEAKINSVERIKEYDKLEQEAPAVIKENRPPKEWPEKGEIVFKNASLRYRQGELVLKQLNVTVDGEEKVGIVGRTGAGKSTLLQALFRIVELAEGSIEIDGIDISTIGLEDLRSKLSIIPQEPVLFLGTVRYNLDPFGEHSDTELWEALNMVNLKHFIESLEGGLDAIVEENGSNFSVGQRQLICMSRALLRKTKILVMDEATASVDLETDLLIQSMVRKNFSDRTSLTIAHRHVK
jgi:ABC-type multidrug transport system fused ATPase/permease subunit